MPSEGDEPGAPLGMSNGCDCMHPGPMVRHVPGLSHPMTSFTGSRKNARICPIYCEPKIS